MSSFLVDFCQIPPQGRRRPLKACHLPTFAMFQAHVVSARSADPPVLFSFSTLPNHLPFQPEPYLHSLDFPIRTFAEESSSHFFPSLVTARSSLSALVWAVSTVRAVVLFLTDRPSFPLDVRCDSEFVTSPFPSLIFPRL